MGEETEILYTRFPNYLLIKYIQIFRPEYEIIMSGNNNNNHAPKRISIIDRDSLRYAIEKATR